MPKKPASKYLASASKLLPAPTILSDATVDVGRYLRWTLVFILKVINQRFAHNGIHVLVVTYEMFRFLRSSKRV